MANDEKEFVPCCHIENCGEHMDMMAKNGLGYCIKHYSKIKESEIAELELYSRKMAQQIMEQSKRSKKMIEEISDLQQKLHDAIQLSGKLDEDNRNLKKENERMDKLLKQSICGEPEHCRECAKIIVEQKQFDELIKEFEQKLANAKNEILDKVVAEIELLIKRERREPDGTPLGNCWNDFLKTVEYDLKSALLAMKKETKT